MEICRKVIITILQLIFGIVILTLLLQQANMSETCTILLNADIRYVIIASFFIVAASMMIALSFHFILKSLKYRVNLLSCVQANFAGQLASDLTPGRAGYFITAFIMASLSNAPLEACFVTTMVSSMVDFSVRAVLAVVSAVFLIGPVESISEVHWIIVASAFILAAGALFFAILLWSDKPRKLVWRLRGFRHLSRLIGPFLSRFESFQKEGVKAKKALGPVVFAMSLITPLEAVALYFFSLSVKVAFNPILLVLIYSLVSSFTYLPLTLAGLGVQEGVLVALLQLFGVPLSQGMSIALLFRFFYTLTDFIGLPPILKTGLSKMFDERHM